VFTPAQPPPGDDPWDRVLTAHHDPVSFTSINWLKTAVQR